MCAPLTTRPSTPRKSKASRQLPASKLRRVDARICSMCGTVPQPRRHANGITCTCHPEPDSRGDDRWFASSRQRVNALQCSRMNSRMVLALLSQTNIATFAGRVVFVTVAGVIAAIATNVSYWNWYGFPKRYTAAYMLIQLVGFVLVGIVGGLMLKRRTQP